MKELYIAPQLNIFCFAPVERLTSTDPYSIQLAADLETGGDGGDGISGDPDNDFGLDIF